MAASITELIFKFTGDSGNLKTTMAQVRAELNQTSRTQTATNRGELSMRQQLSAAASLQRQRSAALISQWKQQEGAARSLASGIQPVSTNLQRITDVMQTLARSTATIQGPLGGVAGRLSSIGAISSEAAGGLGVVGVAIGAVAVAITALSVAFIKLTVSTAEFQGKFADLSQQVGVTVETLSTLNILASTTGGNIDTVTSSLALFQRNLEDAHDPTSKEAKLLKELGVTSLETEAALRQTLKGLFALGTGSKQTDAALQLFGRSGRFVNAILKESQGDLDKATEKFHRMGLVVSTEAAIAADKFNDTLVILSEQLASVGRILVTQTIPVFIAFFEDVSRGLTGNQIDWRRWSNVIEVEVAAVLGILEGFVTWVATRFTIDLGTAIDSSIRGLLDRAQNIRAVISVESTAQRAAAIAGVGARPRGGGGGGGRRARDTSLQDATKEAALAEREALLITAEDITENKRAFEEQARTIEDFTRRAIELNEDQLNATIDRITAESNALDTALARRLIKRSDYETKQRELDLQAAKAHQENKDDQFKLEQERDRQISEARIAAKKRELQISEDADQRQIKRIEDRVDRGVLLESDAERQIGIILDEGFARRREALQEEEDAYSTSLERRKDIDAEIIRLDGERAFSAEQTTQRIKNALKEEAREQKEALEKLRERTKDIERDSAGTAIDLLILNFARRREVVRAEFNLRKSDEERRHNQELDFIAKQRAENEASARTQEQKNERTKELNRLEEAEAERHRLRMKEIKDKAKQDEKATDPIGRIGLDVDNLKEFARVIEDSIVPLGELLTRTFLDVADAIGQTVATWVLLGKTGPAVMRKILAQALASIAAEAAVNAIKELALGFAMLFLNPAEAAAHFASAGLWASIAGVSAIAGRAVAGNLFQPQESGASGGRGGATNERGEPRPIDLVRNQALPPQVIILRVESNDSHILSVIQKDVRRNGPTRDLIVDTAAA